MDLTCWATHGLQWRCQWAAKGRPGANPKKPSQFRLHSATRVHEGGIASNRGSARHGEYVPGPCTHRPSHHGSWVYPKTVREPARDAAGHGRLSDWGEVYRPRFVRHRIESYAASAASESWFCRTAAGV